MRLTPLVAAVAIAGASSASAVPITGFDTLVDNGPLIDSVEIGSVPFTNETGVPIFISGTVAASADSIPTLQALRYGFTAIEDDDSVDLALDDDTFSIDGGASGSGAIERFRAAVDQTFFLVFRDGADADLGDIATTYEVTPAPVPLPAAGWLLLAGLGGLGLLRRRAQRA